MDKRVIEKMNEMAVEVKSAEMALRQEIVAYCDNLFTTEIKDMIKTILDYNHDDYILVYHNHDELFKVDSYENIWVKDLKLDMPECNYITLHERKTQSDLSDVTMHARRLKMQREHFEFLEKNVELLLDEITAQYEHAVKMQFEELDGISKILNIEEKPKKQIKITVEYI